MATSSGASAATLTPLVWIFAASAILLTGLFLLTSVLAARHKLKRKAWISTEQKELPPQTIGVLTVGDLFMDPDLRQKLPERPSPRSRSSRADPAK